VQGVHCWRGIQRRGCFLYSLVRPHNRANPNLTYPTLICTRSYLIVTPVFSLSLNQFSALLPTSCIQFTSLSLVSFSFTFLTVLLAILRCNCFVIAYELQRICSERAEYSLWNRKVFAQKTQRIRSAVADVDYLLCKLFAIRLRLLCDRIAITMQSHRYRIAIT
jgi:hypothetical protein